MAKITELPQASAVTGEDIAVIVQDGVTKRVPRRVLVPDAPDDLLLTDRLLQLGVGGTAIGEGVKLPQEKFELWNDITLAEDTTMVTMNATDSGAALNIKKMFLLFVGSFSAANPTLAAYYNAGELYQMWHSFTLAADTTRAVWVYSEKIAPGVFRSLYCKAPVVSGSPTDMSIQGLSTTNADVMSDVAARPFTVSVANATRWRFGLVGSSASAVMRAGSRIMVWGVQDNG